MTISATREDQSRFARRGQAVAVDDQLWELIEPLLPPWPQKAPGPRPVPDRQVNRTRRTGSTGRERRWTVVTSTRRRGAGTGPSPVNRAKPGSKHHLICDGHGKPIYVLTSGANVPDMSRAADLLDGYHRSPAGRAGLVAASPPYLPARGTAARPSAKPAANAALNRPSRNRKHPTSKAQASCATSSSRPSPCYTRDRVRSFKAQRPQAKRPRDQHAQRNHYSAGRPGARPPEQK
jgi:hypothetical protein